MLNYTTTACCCSVRSPSFYRCWKNTIRKELQAANKGPDCSNSSCCWPQMIALMSLELYKSIPCLYSQIAVAICCGRQVLIGRSFPLLSYPSLFAHWASSRQPPNQSDLMAVASNFLLPLTPSVEPQVLLLRHKSTSYSVKISNTAALVFCVRVQSSDYCRHTPVWGVWLLFFKDKYRD